MNHERLTSSLYRVAIGFGILCFNINLGRINILPNWLGYWLILKSLDDIAEEEASAALLKPLGKILIVWFVGTWILQIMGHTATGGFIVYIVAVEQLYFQYQLLTNIASIAARYVPQFEHRILRLRTVMTLVVTGYTLVSAVVISEALTVIAVVVQLVAAVWLFRTLLNMEHELSLTLIRKDRAERELTFSEQLREHTKTPEE